MTAKDVYWMWPLAGGAAIMRKHVLLRTHIIQTHWQRDGWRINSKVETNRSRWIFFSFVRLVICYNNFMHMMSCAWKTWFTWHIMVCRRAHLFAFMKNLLKFPLPPNKQDQPAKMLIVPIMYNYVVDCSIVWIVCASSCVVGDALSVYPLSLSQPSVDDKCDLRQEHENKYLQTYVRM